MRPLGRMALKLGTKAMTLWAHVTGYAAAIREFIAPTYRPERHYMRGPGPAHARRQKRGIEASTTIR